MAQHAPRPPYNIRCCAGTARSAYAAARGGAERLGLLLRWRRGDLLLGLVFFDTANGDRELANNPFVVDWTDFPTQEALDALNATKR